MKNLKLLSDATRDELIEELKSRTSISSLRVVNGTGATVKTINSSISLEGESWIFIIKPNKKNATY